MPETATPSPTPSPTPSHPAFTNPPASSGASLIQIPAEEFQRLTGIERQHNHFLSEHNKAIEVERQDKLRVMAEKEGADKALQESQRHWEKRLGEETTKFNQVREKYHGKAKAEVLARGLAGREFVGDTPEVKAEVMGNFLALIGPRFETSEDAEGNLHVLDRASRRPAADVLKELVDAPAYANFFAPKTRGGSGTDGSRSASTQANDPNANPHPLYSVEWHAWNLERTRGDLTGLRFKQG